MNHPSLCAWVECEGGVKCDRCGVFRPRPTTRKCGAPAAAAAPKRTPRESLTCRHIGALARVATAACCGGKKTRHKIYTCGLFGECQLGGKVTGVAECRRCEQFASRAVEPPH